MTSPGFAKTLACFLGSALLLIACATEPFDFDAYDYGLERLVIGAAFPPLQQEADVSFTIAACKELGIGWIRYQESWLNREPEKDGFNWEPMDTRIEMLHRAGIKILLTLGGQEWPAWLNSSPGRNDESTLYQFREYVAALLLRYAGKIERIQFGNEWNWEIDDYMAGDEEAFIAYANIVHEEAYRLSEELRPTIVLGSLNGLSYLAFDQGLVSRIKIEGREPYQERIAAYSAKPDRALSKRAENILAKARYDMLDIHLYDDYENWPIYLQALRAVEREVGKPESPVLVSEFGGPYPVSLYGFFGGKPRQSVLARSLVRYVKTLDSMELEEVYFFALAEGGPERYHQDSYLFTIKRQKTPAHEVMRRFGQAKRSATLVR
jgi:hypothetical protein